jgi:hypothetical protein
MAVTPDPPRARGFHAQAADKPTRGKHYGCFQHDGCGLAKSGCEQQDADRAEDEADQEDDIAHITLNLSERPGLILLIR